MDALLRRDARVGVDDVDESSWAISGLVMTLRCLRRTARRIERRTGRAVER